MASVAASSDPAFLSISDLSAAIAAGDIDPLDHLNFLFDRIARLGPALNCFVALCPEIARDAAAAALDRARAGRRIGPLDGIPIALKDNIDLAGVATRNGLGGAAWRIPDIDAEVVRRLKAAGAIILGKLNMHEFAMGATNDNPHFGRAINPHRPDHTPGGSSGGSGVAVAAGLCAAALGTDTGGSVRIPASYCGIVGLKPSYGAVSTRGVCPLSRRLDHVGPLTRTVRDAALMLAAMAGFDPQSPESRRAPDVAAPHPARLDGLVLGRLRGVEETASEPAVAAAFSAAIDLLRTLGAEIRDVELPYDNQRARRAGFLRIEAESALDHGDLFRAEPDRFSPGLAAYLDYGAKLPATRLVGADRLIESANFALDRCFETVDAVLSPATPQASFRFSEAVPENQGCFTIIANFSGFPAISVPMARNAAGLPLGLQIITRMHEDGLALRLAAAYESAANWRVVPPPPFGPM